MTSRRSFLKSGLLWLPSAALAKAASPLLRRMSNVSGLKNPFPDCFAYWSFSEVTHGASFNYVTDSIGGKQLDRYGNLYGETSGKNGMCVRNSNQGALISDGDAPDLDFQCSSSSRSFSGWFWNTDIDGTYGYRTIVCVGAWGANDNFRGLLVGQAAAGIFANYYQPLAYTPPTEYQAVVTASLGMWNHVVVVNDNALRKMTLYVNGVSNSVEHASCAFIEQQVNSYAVGHTRASAGGSVAKINGYCDEYCYWKRPLEYSEVMYLYNSGAGRFL